MTTAPAQPVEKVINAHRTFDNRLKEIFFWDTDDLKGDVLARNEVYANRTLAVAMLSCIILLLVFVALASANMLKVTTNDYPKLLISALCFLVPVIICFWKKGRGTWIKQILLAGFAIGLVIVYVLFSSTVAIIMLLPLIVSCRYYSKSFVAENLFFALWQFIVGPIAGVLCGTIDANAVYFSSPVVLEVSGYLNDAIFALGLDTWSLIVMTLFRVILPNLILVGIVGTICMQSAARGKDIVTEQAAIMEKEARIETDLNLATSIQIGMLPRAYPAFPNHPEFSVYATMQPAREVGGDFYDYFMVDDTHAVIIIADVSGKGVPAALFMVIAKTLIKDYAKLGLEPAEVFTRVNKALCESNESGLFVTAWMAVIDLETGLMKYANAGHNPPLFTDDSGTFHYVKCRPGLVLAGLDSTRYRQAETQLKPGSRIFLYTDGVTEATSASLELYGQDRLSAYLSVHSQDEERVLLSGLRGDVDAFVDGADQFDDITMLVFTLNALAGEGWLRRTFDATDEAYPLSSAFLEESLEAQGVPQKTVMQIAVIFEELFINVAHYAYPGREGDVKIALQVQSGTVKIELKDSGIPFNPLEREDPDITLSPEERGVGGLGIYMAKKMMDEVSYRYVDGMNVVTVIKNYTAE